ncbi:MAG: 50S ribosomal protein L24 [SAR202 cluster bacterium]|jgi:large subunit ribosomal protein L24|nr:MAG: 50S ribosomal protein L24 [SAR202 cluster bacterium]MCH2319682.1 50S ribosomal protein L24 [SAR202 cluster bacterium]MEC7885057.1 50S ribosomal protein L24 [Chloroflexota bacterium]MQF67999.1 50S ribosomal protein L24 [SAR202 cluster bacterium AD-802-K11_MRT_200m]MQG74171.1 50S ribosomal protein L24 [SAR202 cluster bacterium]|tara:strand:- start:6042 stop:6350 length:309 start_codon:yes stop_codon:yes gene_type:complete
MRIKKSDLVLVTKGKDRGKQGTVQQTIASKRRVVVEGVGMVKRHMRAQGMRAAEIIEKEMSVSVDNVMLICTHCQAATKVGVKTLGDGSRARVCKKCQEVIE